MKLQPLAALSVIFFSAYLRKKNNFVQTQNMEPTKWMKAHLLASSIQSCPGGNCNSVTAISSSGWANTHMHAKSRTRHSFVHWDKRLSLSARTPEPKRPTAVFPVMTPGLPASYGVGTMESTQTNHVRPRRSQGSVCIPNSYSCSEFL